MQIPVLGAPIQKGGAEDPTTPQPVPPCPPTPNLRWDRQADERTNRRIDGGADDGPFEGSMKCVSSDDQLGEMNNDDEGVIMNTNMKVRKTSYDEKCTDNDDLMAPSSAVKTDDLKCDIQGVPKKIRLGFCLISRQLVIRFLNCFFLLKTEIHTQILNTKPLLSIIRGLKYIQNKIGCLI